MARYPADETAREHIRNALALVRLTMQTAPVTVGNEGRGFIVSAAALGAMQARLEAALDTLEPPPDVSPFSHRRDDA